MIHEMTKVLHAISIGGDTSSEQLRDLHASAKNAQARLRELVTDIEESIIEHIEATGSDIELNDGKRWYIGSDKKTKAKDDSLVLHAILEASGGDISKLTTGDDGVLASSPWKHGAIKHLIGQHRFDELFETTVTKSLETGKAIKVLKVADPKFLKGGTQ